MADAYRLDITHLSRRPNKKLALANFYVDKVGLVQLYGFQLHTRQRE